MSADAAGGAALDEWPFTLEGGGDPIRGILWTSREWRGPHPLVLAGHGLCQDKRSLYPATLPSDLVLRHGIAVAAIDAPEHGDRRPARADPERIADAWRAHWRAHGASQIVNEFDAAIRALKRAPQVDTARVGYWGLSLAAQYGLGYLAGNPPVRAAVLGLFGMPEPAPRLAAYVRSVTCPIFFLQQLDDEVHPPERTRMLFHAIASNDKTLCANHGGHVEVPQAALDAAYRWLSA